jgi:hypothetical protein
MAQLTVGRKICRCVVWLCGKELVPMTLKTVCDAFPEASVAVTLFTRQRRVHPFEAKPGDLLVLPGSDLDARPVLRRVAIAAVRS